MPLAATHAASSFVVGLVIVGMAVSAALLTALTVLVLLGDDHSGKSSTTAHHSEQAMVAVRAEALRKAEAVTGQPPIVSPNGRFAFFDLRDYARKSGFTDCVLGLSGGIDSAVAAAVAARAWR